MKRIIPIVILVLTLQTVLCLPCSAQDTIKKIIDNGDDTSRFVFVVIAEGYTAAEMQKFDNDCHTIISYFFSSLPWHDYQSFVNVYSIFSFSNQSGADIPSEDVYVDTAFDATFDSFGINNLLTVNDAKAFETAAQVPTFDAVFVLVNDARYGGSGGSTIVLSTHTAAGEIALHEAGHFIGHLADEYETPYASYPSGAEEPNITFQN
ncbi:MAG: M64 family metallo-endopeptidase, partial [Proteobacteria bacterium]|nr:M64 family metallo-endopeptidase [Pseudomonadota bacterium]